MNIFDSITKEKFIEEFNKENNGSLSFLHIILAFDYIGLTKDKEIDKRTYLQKLCSITDINDYEEEIMIFNSFKPFVEYMGKPVLVVSNYNKYLIKRNKLENKLGYEKKSYRDNVFDNYVIVENLHSSNIPFYLKRIDYHLVIKDMRPFNKFVKEENIKKELDLLYKKNINRILSIIEHRFLELEDDGYKTEFTVDFKQFGELKRDGELKEKHLTENNVFDEFTLRLNFGPLSKVLEHSSITTTIDDYLKLCEEYLLTIKDVGEFLGCNVIMNGLGYFTFKKK